MSFRGGHLIHRFVTVSGMAALLLTSLAPPAAAADPLQVKAGGFNRPLYVTHAGDDRLFVVEQGGLIRIINGDGSVRTRPFLNISTAVACCGERGLLGLAFHPDYATNRLFYVNFTRKSDGATVVAEFRRSTDPNLADPHSFRPVLVIPQPYSNHNGGWIGFRGGKLLFIATGDGGSGGDPHNNAQNLNSLLGKILRINPLDPDGSGPRRYKVPPRNPFVGRAGRDEIWAYGVRNPWRCSFDRGTGKLWCADVGQGRWEEINRAKGTKGGLNYGWRVMEGRECYHPASGCNTTGKKLPIAVYSHASGCSVTGGYVARRSGATLHGRYIFGDFCSGNLWTISATHPSGARLPAPTPTGRSISSFGEGRDGRIYLTDLSNGVVYYVRGT